jgi:hypothetical protein
MLEGVYCCSRCKPILLQKVREGCTDVPPSILSVTYHSTRATHWRCNLYPMLHKKRFALVSAACVLLISTQLPIPDLASSVYANGVMRLIAATVVLGLSHFAFLAVAILTRVPPGKPSRSCTSGLMPEGVFDFTPEKRRVVPWRKITAIRDHDGDIHVWFGFNGIYIPREAFKDLEEAHRFAGLAVELWHSQGSLWPQTSAKQWRST